VQSSCKT